MSAVELAVMSKVVGVADMVLLTEGGESQGIMQAVI